jgi:CRP-like cAMP-binding protein
MLPHREAAVRGAARLTSQRKPPLEQAAVRNRLLAALPPEDFARLVPRLEPASLAANQVLIAADEPIRSVHFPEAGVVSVLAMLGEGKVLEVGLIGREGMVGLPVILGADRTPHESRVQLAGSGWRLDAAVLRQELERSATLRRLLLLHAASMYLQVSQLAGCNGCHALAQRLARWLLMMHDRGEGDALVLTHAVLAKMLGVRRAGITTLVATLQAAGAIRSGRGRIEILDRQGLEAASCPCYHIIRQEAEHVLAQAAKVVRAPAAPPG